MAESWGEHLEEMLDHRERFLKAQESQPMVLVDPDEIAMVNLHREKARDKVLMDTVQQGLQNAWVEIKALQRFTDDIHRIAADEKHLTGLATTQGALWVCWAASAIAIVVLFVR